MRVLDKKLLRDMRRLWVQSLAIALVLSCGVATLILAVGSHRSLDETRNAYYERHRFAHLFANATRAPRRIAREIEQVPGIAAVEPRVIEPVILDVPGMAEPGSGLAISIPDHGAPRLNRLYIRKGRLPHPTHSGEAAATSGFATAHSLKLGAKLRAIIDGKKRELKIVGIVDSPEFVYALGPGDLVPDDRRFAVLWIPERELEAITDRKEAFNNLTARLLKNANFEHVRSQVDALLRPFGGTGAYGRRDQISHAILDSELEQLAAMARVIPPVFLFVSAYLINMILSRLIALEREQIGLLKALGYANWTIAWHYIKLVLLIAAVGIAIGFLAGTWLGRGLTKLYGEFFSFPFLIFTQSADVYIIAAAVSAGAAVAGALKAVIGVVRLPPAVAMRPPAPTAYRRSLAARLGLSKLFSQLTNMALRHIARWPVRAGLTAFGTSLAVALLVVAMFARPSIDYMIDTIFFQSDRQDATIGFAQAKGPESLLSVAQMPGVLNAEGFRHLSVRITNGPRSRRLVITGKPAGATLSRVLDLDLKPVRIPEQGLAVSERVAQLLDLKRGDRVQVELLEEGRGVVDVQVSAIIQSFLGLVVFMDLDALNRLIGLGPRISGAYVSINQAHLLPLYDKIKSTPALSSIALQTQSRLKFREIIERNITISTTLYIVLAVIISFGVVYNSARIQFSERARELASLRVLGFTRSEVARVLLIELLIIVALAQPLGWLSGYGLTWAVIQGFASDQFRVPLIIDSATFATASLIVCAVALISAAIVHHRVKRLDLIRVLKSRD